MPSDGELMTLTDAAHLGTYRRLPVVIRRAAGVHVWDGEGRRYLDLLSGLGVASVGHNHPRVVEAIRTQAEKVLHTSNLYYNEPQALLAARLSELSGGRRVFFANSGAEANEGAVKIARRYGRGRYEVLTLPRSFHGRTLAMVAATGQERYREGYEPLPAGFRVVEAVDPEAVRRAVGPHTIGVLVEPVQGEGGVHPLPASFLAELAEICRERELLLLFDEVQCGLGRTGYLFAEREHGIRPQIITLAKALGGGVPIGAILVEPHVAEAMRPGDHASTFGGGPLAAAAALAVLEVLEEENLPERARELGAFLGGLLEALRQAHPELVRGVRGKGLMWGVDTAVPAGDVVREALAEGVIVGTAGSHVVRLLPPLVIGQEQLEEGVRAVERALVRAARGQGGEQG